MQRSGRVHLREVNKHLVCVLCGGYYIDATTIVECLHSFCRSCLIKYLESNSFCPICDVQIHKAKPFLNIKPDKALQDIVYKLVPGLFHAEMRRRRDFYTKHPERANETTPEGRGVGVERLIYSPEDSISLSLEYLQGECDDLGCVSSRSSVSDSSTTEVAVNKRYLQCPALVTIAHLKKFIRLKYELNSTHSVEIIHMRESLPDEYTLMDVAYIYTWKRNGPIRFFYRICQNQEVLASAPVEKQLSAVTTSSSAEQPSTQTTSQLSSTVSRLTEPLSSNAEQETERLPPTTTTTTTITITTTTQTPVPSTQTVAITVSSQKPSDIAKAVSIQPHVITVTQSSVTVATDSIQAVATPDQIASVSPATASRNVNSSQSFQANVPDIRTQNRTRFVTKATSPSSITVTRTPSVTRPINPLTPAVTKAPTVPVGTASLPSSTVISKIPVQQQAHCTAVTKPHQQPGQAVITKQCPPVASTGIPTHQQTSEITNKEVGHIPVKTLTQSPSTDSAPSEGKLSSIRESNLPKSDQVLSGEVPDDNKTKPTSLPVGPGNAACEVLPERSQPSGISTTNCKETAVVNCKDTLPAEVNKKTVSEPDFTTNVPPDTANKTKPILPKSVQHRAHMLAKKSSLLIKVTSDTTNTKAQLSAAKHQLSAAKDTARLSRVSQKVNDKHTSNCLTFRKDKPDESDRKDVRKEPLNIVSDAEKRLEKQAVTTKSTPLASNNNNKFSQQSLQVIKNNQQILKKNDEIMRCSNTIKRSTQVLQRKPQDVLKTCSAQLRVQDDKSTSIKRCAVVANPMKRSLVNSAGVTEQDDVEPVAKKWRLVVENNHKIIHADQKSSELKVKCTPNSNECQPTQNATEKSDASKVSPFISKTSNSRFQSPALTETTDRQKNHGVHKNSATEKAQSCTPVQRPAYNTQPNTISKQYDGQSRTPAPNPDVTPPQVPGSSSCGRNVQSPSVPVPAVAHCNVNPRLHPPSLKGKPDGECNDVGALDLSASPRRQQHSTILSIAQTLARRHQQQCPSPAPPPLSPLSSLSPFPVMSVPVRSPPPQLRIPVPPHHRSGHSQQQRPSSLSSSSPSPPADMLPGSSRTGQQHQHQHQQQQSPLDMCPSHLLPPTALMFRQQLEMQRLWSSGKHSPNPRMEWFNDAKSIKSFENFMKSLQQQQGGRNASFYPYNNNNNTSAAPSSHRK